jgi:hypothetical protein
MTRLALTQLKPVDGNGNPYPGGKLQFFDAGASTTPKTVYSDSTLLVSLGSEVTADGEGVFTDIYYSGDIRYVLRDSNNVIQYYSDVYGAGNVDTGDLADGAVTTIKIDDAAVTLGKLLTLDNGKIITSNGSANSQVTPSGDVTMSNTGVFTTTYPAGKAWKSSTVGGTANAITCVSSPVITALADGMILFLNPTANTTSTTPTIAPDGLTARTIVSASGALKPGDIQSGKWAELQYDLTNTRWILKNPAFGAKSDYGAPAAQSYAKNTVKTFAHGLGAVPTFVQVYLVCTTGEHGYSVNDVLYIAPFAAQVAGIDYGFSVVVDSTNVTVRIANDGITIIENQVTRGTVVLTDANWNIGIRCFY